MLEVLPELPDDVVYLIAGGGNDARGWQESGGARPRDRESSSPASFPKRRRPISTRRRRVRDAEPRRRLRLRVSRSDGVGRAGDRQQARRRPRSRARRRARAARRSRESAELRAAIVELLARGDGGAIPAGLDYFSFANFTLAPPRHRRRRYPDAEMKALIFGSLRPGRRLPRASCSSAKATRCTARRATPRLQSFTRLERLGIRERVAASTPRRCATSATCCRSSTPSSPTRSTT